MAKVTLDDITSNYASVVQLNARFQVIEDQLNNAVFYRANPVGEPNSLQNDLDMNSYDILNANAVYASSVEINGVPVTANSVAPNISGNFVLASGQTIVDIAVPADDVTVFVSGPDVDGERLLRDIDYTTSGSIITLTESYPAGSVMSVVSYEPTERSSGNPALNFVRVDNFTGNGTTTEFSLSQTPIEVNNLWAYIDGVYQNKSTYTLIGNRINFSEAPPNLSEIEVSYGYTIASVVDYLKVNSNLSDLNDRATAVTNLLSPELTFAGSDAKFTGTLAVDKQTTNGKFIYFQKDGNEIGSIGSLSGVVCYIILDPRFVEGDPTKSGMGIRGWSGASNPGLVPTDKDGVFTNGIANIGATTAKWKDGWFAGVVDANTVVANNGITTAGLTSTLSVGVTGTVTADGFISNITTTAVSKGLTNGETCVVTAATQTLTLPASPAVGSNVTIFVGNFVDTVVARNGSNIMGLASDLTLNVADSCTTLVYTDATYGWRIK